MNKIIWRKSTNYIGIIYIRELVILILKSNAMCILLNICVTHVKNINFTILFQFLKFLRQFLKKGPDGYNAICIDKLRRTITNGARNQPPSWLELNGLKVKKSLLLRVTLMDGNDVAVPVDASTISYELCDFVATKIDLRDCFGFSLYIALSQRVRYHFHNFYVDQYSKYQALSNDQAVCKMGRPEQQ